MQRKGENQMNKKSLHFLKVAWIVGAIFCSAQNLQSSPDFYVPADPPRAQYIIDGKVEVSQGSFIVSGQGTIVFEWRFHKPLSIIALSWDVDAATSLEISVQGKPLRLMNADKDLPASTPLFYELPKPLAKGARLKLDVKFSRRFEAGADVPTIPLRKWYPSLWWERIPTSDSFKVKIVPPPGYTMATSGRLNRKSGYYENDRVATSFGIYLAQGLKAEQREVEGVLITAFFTKEGEECARICLDAAVDIIRFYKNWLGFYPFKSLCIIPGASRPMGGYPFASAMVVVHGQEKFKEMPLLHWKWITAHEIGHQYWGEYVMSDDFPYSYTSSWVHIGLGIYTDREWTLARNLGLEKHVGFLERYLDGVKKHYDTTVDAPPSLLKLQKYDLNNIVIHGKGFAILSALESVVGKKSFEKIFKRCLREYGDKRMSWRDFKKICEKETSENLSWFFEQWVRSNKYLCYQIKSQSSEEENGRYITKVSVQGDVDSIQMPIPVKVVFEDGTEQVKTTDRVAKTSTLRFESQAKLKEAILNPDKNLAMLLEPLPILPSEIPERVEKLPWTGAGESALEVFRLSETHKIDDPGVWLKLGLVLFDGAYYKESRAAFKRIVDLKGEKELSFVALVWMGHNEDLLGDREKAIACYREALKYDTGSSMRHDQYGIIINRGWVEERLKKPFERPSKKD